MATSSIPPFQKRLNWLPPPPLTIPMRTGAAPWKMDATVVEPATRLLATATPLTYRAICCVVTSKVATMCCQVPTVSTGPFVIISREMLVSLLCDTMNTSLPAATSFNPQLVPCAGSVESYFEMMYCPRLPSAGLRTSGLTQASSDSEVVGKLELFGMRTYPLDPSRRNACPEIPWSKLIPPCRDPLFVPTESLALPSALYELTVPASAPLPLMLTPSEALPEIVLLRMLLTDALLR